jgi:thymidylate synthase (FAD)
MRIYEPSFEIWLQEPGLDGVYRQVERAGRVCYKSEDHRTAESDVPFVERMIKSDHSAMLEHATVYLTYGEMPTASA